MRKIHASSRPSAGTFARSRDAFSSIAHRFVAPGPDRVFVFQEFDQLLPWKTVKDNITFALTASGKRSRRDAEDRARELIEKVKLTDLPIAIRTRCPAG